MTGVGETPCYVCGTTDDDEALCPEHAADEGSIEMADWRREDGE